MFVLVWPRTFETVVATFLEMGRGHFGCRHVICCTKIWQNSVMSFRPIALRRYDTYQAVQHITTITRHFDSCSTACTAPHQYWDMIQVNAHDLACSFNSPQISEFYLYCINTDVYFVFPKSGSLHPVAMHELFSKFRERKFLHRLDISGWIEVFPFLMKRAPSRMR